MIEQKFPPLANIREYLSHNPQITNVELSVYTYHPQSISDEREVFHVPPMDLGDFLIHTTANLSSGQEVAFHSKVLVNTGTHQEVRHIPMIDFCAKVSDSVVKKTEQVLAEFNITNAWLFHSGRSFHLYGGSLLTHKEWIRFMGRVLLMNSPDQSEVIDSRWVGHCLMAGTSRLRLTKNSDHYISEPKFVKAINAFTDFHKNKLLEHA